MADNYLENKMEEHRRNQCGAGQRPAVRRTSPGLKPGQIAVDFPPGLRVVVTGGASGIGRAIVKAFRKIDARVDFIDRDIRLGNRVAQETGARFIPADIADAASLDSAIGRIIADRGDIDIVVNNAGIARFTPLEELTAENFDLVTDTNLRPAALIAAAIARHRASLPSPNPYGGRIINISSTRASMSEISTEAYSASKGALRSLTHALMMSLAPFSITVNSISPGWIECADPGSLTEADRLQHPSRRVGTPDDIARIALFLAYPANNFINGADIVADGGMTRKMIYV